MRPDWDEYFLSFLPIIASRSTCDRGKPACLITKDKRIIILDKDYSWKKFMPNYPEPLFVIHPSSNRNTWSVDTVRKPNEKFMEYAQYAGMILLLALLVYANGNDIFKLFR